jgi:uncharacterized membrane protein
MGLATLSALVEPATATAQRLVVPSCAQDAALIGMGRLKTGNNSKPDAISADGLVAVGQSSTQGPSTLHAFRFTESDGIADLGKNGIRARDVSADGSVAVGTASTATGNVAARWDADGFLELGFIGPTANQRSDGYGVSGDGRVVVGYSTGPGGSGSTVGRGFRWTAETGMQALPSLYEGADEALGVSRDGKVAVGRSGIPGGGYEATRWDNGNVTGLGHLPDSICEFSNGGSAPRTIAFAASGDGSVVVGADLCSGLPAGHAVIWDKGGINSLPALGESSLGNRAFAVSQDGSIIVGRSGDTAVVWTVEEGVRSVVSILESYEVDTSDWDDLTQAFGVSQASFGTVIVGTGRRPDLTQEAFMAILPCDDEDEDGLCDHWEEMEGVDLNADGKIVDGEDVLLPGADPLHKNLYVEVDFIWNEKQIPPFEQVEAAFAAVPNALIGNPDGKPGIDLHIELSDTGLELPDNTYSFPPGSICPFAIEYAGLKASNFGNTSEQSNPELIRAKKRIYRYAIMGGAQPDGTAGVGEAPAGNDLVVTIGEDEFDRYIASSFMHELGHTLGLFHGGPDSLPERLEFVNFKPNYHSVMNYLWIDPDEGSSFEGTSLARKAFFNSWVLDFSRRQYNDLDEKSLDEFAGIGGNPLNTVPIGPPPGRLVNEAYPVDFNRNGAIDFELVGSTESPINLNRLDESFEAYDEAFDHDLRAADDWTAVAGGLCAGFQHSQWNEGVHSCDTLPALHVGGSNVGVDVPPREPELTEEDRRVLAAITFIDCNGNNIIDDDDLFTGSTDLNDNGLLDECELLAGDIDQDEDVDEEDRLLFVGSFGSGEGDVEYLALADLDANRTVALPDYQRWADAFNAATLTNGEIGEEFEIQIESELGAAALGFGLDLLFDLEIVEIVGEPVLDPAWTAVFARDLDGLAGLAPASGLSGSRRIATVTLRALSRGTSSLDLHVDARDETEGTWLDGMGFADSTLVGASLRVGEIVCGDATGDAVMTATDALIALRVAVGSGSCEACICDVDGSGATTATDALRILQAAVGQQVVLSCTPC